MNTSRLEPPKTKEVPSGSSQSAVAQPSPSALLPHGQCVVGNARGNKLIVMPGVFMHG